MINIEQESQEIKAEKLYDRLQAKLEQKLGDEGCLAFELSESEAKMWNESDGIRYDIRAEFDRYEFDFVFYALATKLYIHYELVDKEEEEDE